MAWWTLKRCSLVLDIVQALRLDVGGFGMLYTKVFVIVCCIVSLRYGRTHVLGVIL